MYGWKIMLFIGNLLNIGMQLGSAIDLCTDPIGTINPLWTQQEPRKRDFDAGKCGWRDNSLLLVIKGDCSRYNYNHVEIQGREIYVSQSQSCVVVSKEYNNSANPTSYFSNCEAVLWIPLKDENAVTLTIPRRCGMLVKYEFKKAKKAGSRNYGESRPTNGTVIALAILFSMTLIGLLVLLVIMFKEKLVTLVNETKLRVMKPSNTETSPTRPASNGVYAEAVDPSIYHEVDTHNEQVVVHNQLYGMT